ncbi:MAG TPA: hypothetical protein VEK57_28410 [Thermoanaerobaculia bacterium]|nr:hypothetical protein [Thermoanaerobaculia bacterium]
MTRQDAAAALLLIALSVGMTWPLAPNLDRAVSDPGDPYINIWILDWDWRATFSDPLSLFHANAFHPARYSLAFSENLYGLAVLLFPLRVLGMGPIAAYNMAMLAGFAFCGFAAYLLGRRLTGSWTAGLAAGIFYAFVPWRFVHLAHVQHIQGGWLPLLFLALLRYAEKPTRKRAIAFAAVFLMNGLTNIHFLFFGALAAAIVAVLLLPREHWRELALATAGALLLLAPFLYPYAVVAKLYGMQRSAEEVLRFSAMPLDWLPGVEEPERKLYPGALAYAAALAAFAAWRRWKPQLALGWLLIVLGFAGSLGLNFFFHQFLFGGVPGFRAVRSPARWAVIAYIGLSILIAVVTAVLARRKRWLALVVPVALVVELWAGPVRWYMAIPEAPEVYRWLAKQPPRAIVELPIGSAGPEYLYMLRATAHGQRMANGISGFSPPRYHELTRLWNELDDRFVGALREAGVGLVVVHADMLGDRTGPTKEWVTRELARGRLRFVGGFHTPIEGDWVFAVARAEGQGPRAEGTPLGPRPSALGPWLAGNPTCGPGTMGALDFPPGGTRFEEGRAIFSGWVISPHGIRSVDLLFDNHRERVRANLVGDRHLEARCPGLGFTRTRYVAVFEKRPPGVDQKTDVQVEVTDGRGERTLFEARWISWD